MTCAAAIVAAAVLLASCGSAKESEKAVAAGKPMQLKVMEYNIEYGGTLVSLKKTEEAITLAGADVVGIEESYNNLPKIAKATGYPYYNISLQILSKYPIYEPSGGDGLYALIEVQPGYVIAFCNIHLDYVKDGPTALLKGKPVEAVIATENEVRTSALSELLPVLSQLATQGYPVFLTGDFNEPSSLDYVAATVGLRPQITSPSPGRSALRSSTTASVIPTVTSTPTRRRTRASPGPRSVPRSPPGPATRLRATPGTASTTSTPPVPPRRSRARSWARSVAPTCRSASSPGPRTIARSSRPSKSPRRRCRRWWPSTRGC